MPHKLIASARYSRTARLVAIDPSPEMLSAAITRQPEVPHNVHFVLASAESFEPHGKFSLVVAAESLQWMEWSSVLPKVARCLSHDGRLAIVLPRGWVGLPWEAELRALLARHSTNQDYRPYDLVEELAQRGLFEEQGRTRAVQPYFEQDLATYIEAFHARNGFSRQRMGEAAAQAFDGAVRELVLRHRPDGKVSGELAASVVWGSVGGLPH